MYVMGENTPVTNGTMTGKNTDDGQEEDTSYDDDRPRNHDGNYMSSVSDEEIIEHLTFLGLTTTQVGEAVDIEHSAIFRRLHSIRDEYENVTMHKVGQTCVWRDVSADTDRLDEQMQDSYLMSEENAPDERAEDENTNATDDGENTPNAALDADDVRRSGATEVEPIATYRAEDDENDESRSSSAFDYYRGP